MSLPLFTVPAGTKIEALESGIFVFCEPGKRPYWITINAGPGMAYSVTKHEVSISPDCVAEITIGTDQLTLLPLYKSPRLG